MSKRINMRLISAKKTLGIILSAVILLCSGAISPISLNSSAKGEGVPSIFVKRTMYNPYFVQQVYLEPETEYVFSYLYSSLPAIEIAVYENKNNSFSMQSRLYSDDENRISRSFTTVSAEAASGSLDSSGNILSYVGIAMKAREDDISQNNPDYIDGKCLYGGFILYKKSDSSKTNLFKDTSFSSIGYNSSGSGVWTSLPAANGNFAILNFGKYDADASLDGNQDPSADVYSCPLSERALKLHEVASEPYLLQTVYLKPNVSYVFSYLYSKAPASFAAIYKDASGNSFEASRYVDASLKKVSYEFVASSAGASFGSGENSGLIKAMVGLGFLKEDTHLVGGYYADFDLYEKSDSAQNDLLADSRFSDMGSIAAGNIWHSLSDSASAASSFKKAEDVSDFAFDRAYTVAAKAVKGGRISLSSSVAYEGSSISVNVIPDSGYIYREGSLAVNGRAISAVNGVYSFSCPAANAVVTAEFIEENPAAEQTVPSIFVKRTMYYPHFVQKVYLEPETEYVFSYLYSNLPAYEVAVYGARDNNYAKSDSVYSSTERRISRSFTTASADTAKDFLDSNGNILSYVGIHMAPGPSGVGSNNPDYLDGKCLYGDFILYKKSDASKTNLFTDTAFTSIGYNNSGAGVWTSLPAVNSNFAVINFGKYDADSAIAGHQDPSKSIYMLPQSEASSYEISSLASENGVIKAASSLSKAGDAVSVEGAAADGYYLKNICLTNGEVLPAFAGVGSFTMPDTAVGVYGMFEEILLGDSNADGAADVKDLVRIKKHLAGLSFDLITENSDLNSNAAVDIEDAVFMRKKLLGLWFNIDFLPYTGGKVISGLSGGADAEAAALENAIDSSTDSLNISGKTYYLSQNGSDSNSGLSAKSPIKTIAKLETLSLNAGDGVLFERDSIFRINTAYRCVAGVKYGAYGSGEKPRIYGSEKNYADSSAWSATGYENVWRVKLTKKDTVYADAGLIVFGNNETIGTKQKTLNALVANEYFYYSSSEQAVYLYCDKGNPGSVYSSIEIGRRSILFSVDDNVVIDNLAFMYTGAHGIAGGSGVSGVTITNCEIAYIGGSAHYDTRYGNGIEFYNGCSNILVENCHIYQVYDAGITFQGDDETAEYKNITFKGNLIEYCSWSIEWWSGWEKPFVYFANACVIAPIENIDFTSNIMRFEGFGWSGITRSPCHIHGPWNIRTYTNFANFNVTDNIFDSALGEVFNWRQAAPPVHAQQGFNISGNTYYKIATDDNMAFYLGVGEPVYAENQSELEAAVEKFDSAAKQVSWLG